jgi:dTDP-4-amino-4,6-dideoxygalactose transaminase
VGFNYRMSNVLAGIGRGQLRVLEQRVAQRRQVFERYRRLWPICPQLQWMPEPGLPFHALADLLHAGWAGRLPQV